MGGRQPGSKKGIIRIHQVELPSEVLELVIDEHLELAEKLGIESGPREERGITKDLYQDYTAALAGAGAQAFQTKVSPLVGNAVTILGAIALTRGGNALGGAKGKTAKAAGLGLYGLEGGNIIRFVLDSLSRSASTDAQVSLHLVRIGAQELPRSPSQICPHCGKPTSTQVYTESSDFSGMF